MILRRRTRGLWLLVGLITMSLMVVFIVSAGAVVPVASCTTTNHVSGSNFEIEPDANLLVGPGACIDWLDSSSAFMASVQLKHDKPTGSGDDSFGQGTSEDTAAPTITDGSIPPNKSDLKDFGVNSETTTSGKFLQLFWSRVQNPSGTTNMDFELNREFCDGTAVHCADNGTKTPVYVTPKRTAGDKLITYDLSNGGTVPSISIRTWSGTAWGPATLISGGGGSAVGSVNTSSIAAANSGGLGDLSPYTFGEASLSYAAVFGGQACGTFGSAYLKSRSSDSFTSALKDFIAPQPVTISNCASLTTGVAQNVTIGATINDTATLSGASNPSGTVTFKLYGPFTGSDPAQDSCSAGTLLSTITGSALTGPDANGDYTSSASSTPTAVGRYRWVASFASGDANNSDAGPTLCLDAAELDTIAKQQPTLATGVAQSVIVGATINDRATLSGAALTGSSVGGTVEFKLYGPFTGSDPTQDSCSAGTLLSTIAGSALAAGVGGTFTSDASSTPTAVGRYRWVATYTGDTKNESAGPTLCLDAAELDTVNPVVSGITTSQAWYPNDTATITGGGGGTVDFKLYGPFTAVQTPVCTGTPVVSALNRTVSGASASTGNTTQAVTVAGKYVWLVVYSGDSTHTGATSACGAEQFTLDVTNG